MLHIKKHEKEKERKGPRVDGIHHLIPYVVIPKQSMTSGMFVLEHLAFIYKQQLMFHFLQKEHVEL